jgi:hypothetical protein
MNNSQNNRGGQTTVKKQNLKLADIDNDNYLSRSDEYDEA